MKRILILTMLAWCITASAQNVPGPTTPGRVSTALTPTTQTSIGLFYSPDAPERTDLRQPDDEGPPLNLRGRIVNTRGEPLPGATVEMWHADAAGGVDEDSSHPGHGRDYQRHDIELCVFEGIAQGVCVEVALSLCIWQRSAFSIG